MPAGAAHLDIPTFRGLGRNGAPIWLLSIMGSTGLFSRWAVPVAAALTWVYEEAGDGAYEFWPDGPSQPRSSVTAPFGNHALVGDNDYMFHRVAPIGDAEKWPLAQRFSIHARLEYRGDTACVVDGDDVAVTLRHRRDPRVTPVARSDLRRRRRRTSLRRAPRRPRPRHDRARLPRRHRRARPAGARVR